LERNGRASALFGFAGLDTQAPQGIGYESGLYLVLRHLRQMLKIFGPSSR
jgi:hypothetical protein